MVCRFVASDRWRPAPRASVGSSSKAAAAASTDYRKLRDGRAVLVVGASSGVGYGVAEALTLDGFDVLLAGRSLPRLLAARRRIEAAVARRRRRCASGPTSGGAPHPPRLGSVKVFETVDLSCEKSVRVFAQRAAKSGYSVGVVVLAAGVLSRRLQLAGETHPTTGRLHPLLQPPDSAAYTAYRNDVLCNPLETPHSFGRQKDDARERRLHDGFRDVEVMLAANAVGPLLLSRLLLPLLQATQDSLGVRSRLLFVASSCHTFLGTAAYAQEKLNCLLGRPLSTELRERPLRMIRALTAWREAENAERLRLLEHAQPAGGKETSSAVPHDSPDFSGMGFVAHYGLSKLCVVWNAQLMSITAEQHASAAPLPGASTKSRKSNQKAQESAAGDNPTGAHSGVLVASTHPGIIASHLYRDLFPCWLLDYVIYPPSLLLGKTWAEGAASTVRLVSCPEEDVVSGAYYAAPGASANAGLSSHARDTTLRDAYGEWAGSFMQRTVPVST